MSYLALLLDFLHSVPDVIWSGVIASALTLSGALISNRSATTRLRIQLDHEAQERNRERKAGFRREIYLAVAEELSKATNYFGSLPNLDPANVNLADGVQGFFRCCCKVSSRR